MPTMKPVSSASREVKRLRRWLHGRRINTILREPRLRQSLIPEPNYWINPWGATTREAFGANDGDAEAQERVLARERLYHDLWGCECDPSVILLWARRN